MWRSGVVRRKRHIVLAAMIESAVRRGDFSAPWRSTPAVWDYFADEGGILRELQQDWRTALAGEVYVAIEAGDGDLHADVVKAFTKVHRRHRGLRAILEANADHPAIAAAMRKERALLSGFLGLVDAVAADEPAAASVPVAHPQVVPAA